MDVNNKDREQTSKELEILMLSLHDMLKVKNATITLHQNMTSYPSNTYSSL